MEYRNLGKTGLRVSALGLGCNNFGGRLALDASREVIAAALDHGVTLLDTADTYGQRGGSESILGEVLGARRNDVVLATKFSGPMDDAGHLAGASRRYVFQAVEASLRRLKTDWIDLYQLHWPDPRTPIDETLGALDDLTRQGKVRYAGCSRLGPWQLVDAHWTARTNGTVGFISHQAEYSLLARGIEDDLLPALERCGMGLLPFFPLASGLLTGKYLRGAAPDPHSRMATMAGQAERFLHERNWDTVERLRGFCETRGLAMLDVAFGWLKARPLVASVIAGATSVRQVEANAGAMRIDLGDEDLDELDRLTKQHSS